MQFREQFIALYEKLDEEVENDELIEDVLGWFRDEYREDYVMAKRESRAYQLQALGPDEFPFSYYMHLATEEIPS